MIYFENHFYDQAALSLSTNNRGWLYGDGFFETMIADTQQVRFWASHWARFVQAIKAFQLKQPSHLTSSYLQDIIQQMIRRTASSTLYRIKWMVWRADGGRYTPQQHQLQYMLISEPTTYQLQPIRSAMAYRDMSLYYTPVSAFKTLSALPYVMAGIFKAQIQVDEVLLLDVNGYVSECLASNIFWLKDNTLYTPAPEAGCVVGVMRHQIIEWATQNKLNCREGLFTWEQLLTAEAVFVSNVSGIRAVLQIANKSYALHPLVDRLQADLCGLPQ
ncbi:MAG: aminotransferase class IV [Bacteroidota bacterium]